VEHDKGKEVANEVFPQAWLAAESMSHSHRVALVFINEVGTEGSIGSSPLEIFLGFIFFFGSPPTNSPSLLGGSLVVESGSHCGVNLLF